MSTTDFFHSKYQQFKIPVPEVHFVLGSLFGDTLFQVIEEEKLSLWEHRGQISFSEVPDLKSTTAFSHLGEYHYFYHKTFQKSICFQSGRLHGYEGLSPQEVVLSVTGPRSIGTSCFILSNISGSLTRQLPVGSVVAITDHINLTGQSPLCGQAKKNIFKNTNHSSVFIDMNQAYHPHITKEITQIMKSHTLTVNEGVYAGVLGPQLETPAEIRMICNLGADIVGMSTIWEVIALRYAKARVSAFSVISNLACGVGESVDIDYHSINDTLKKVIQSFIQFAENKP